MFEWVLLFLTEISTMGNTDGVFFVFVGRGSFGADTSFLPSNTQEDARARW